MFIYKTIHKDGRYYIGRCSRKNSDSYLGSGRWVQSIKDKSTLHRVILSTHDTFEELCEAEEAFIKLYIDDPMCMNWNNKSVGFATGELNPSCRRRGLPRMKHTEETKKKISETRRKQIEAGEWSHPMFGKETSETQKQRTANANCNEYEVTRDGKVEHVKNMRQWCLQNGFSDIAFHRRHKEGKPYRGMTYIKLPK